MSEKSGRTNANPNQGNPNVLAGAMIVGAILVAVIGTLMPSLVELTGPEAIWIPVIFYGIAAFEVVIALYLRARLLKARRPLSSGGTIQRQ